MGGDKNEGQAVMLDGTKILSDAVMIDALTILCIVLFLPLKLLYLCEV